MPGKNLSHDNMCRVRNDREDLSRDGNCSMFIIQTKLDLEDRRDLPDKSLITMQTIVVAEVGELGLTDHKRPYL
jgi:hypothetical protein